MIPESSSGNLLYIDDSLKMLSEREREPRIGHWVMSVFRIPGRRMACCHEENLHSRLSS
jgi:hypothetical protein